MFLLHKTKGSFSKEIGKKIFRLVYIFLAKTTGGLELQGRFPFSFWQTSTKA